MNRLTANCLIAATATSIATSVSATVFEFSETGQQVVVGPAAAPSARERRTETQPIRRATRPERTQYRTLAEQTALRFSGEPGVRDAGLSALEFARLFVALVDQESRFDPRAVSPKGAQGLGQLMPQTAELLGVADPFDPVENLNGAARYFVSQLATFGTVDLALAAYNAGPHRVDQYGGIPPFRETQNYVRVITRAAGLAGIEVVPVNEPRRSPPSSTANPDERTSVWEF